MMSGEEEVFVDSEESLADLPPAIEAIDISENDKVKSDEVTPYLIWICVPQLS
jgi:hypothetical protein